MEYLKLRQEVERRLPFLFPADERTLEPESDLEHLLAERALVERILGYCASIFYNAVDDSSNIDPESGQLLLSHWEQPTLESSCLLLKRMLVRGIVRAESLFDLKGNEKASVVHFTRELIDSLQHLNELLLLAPDRPEEFTPEHARQLHGAMASCCFLIVSHLKGKGAAEEREPEAILRALEDSFSHSLSGLRALEKEKRRAARRRQRRPPTSTLYPFLAPGEDGDLLLFEGIRHGQIFYWSLRDGERVAVKNRKMVPHLLVFLMRFGLYREASVLAKTWKREVNRAMEPTLLQYLKHCDAAENYRALQEPRLASIEYEKAIRLKRQWPIPYYRRAMLHQEQGRPEKAVLELRPALDWHKGRALELIHSRRAPQACPVYVGDDATDEDAFRAAQAAGGFGVFVGPPGAGTCAGWRLNTPADVTAALAELLESG